MRLGYWFERAVKVALKARLILFERLIQGALIVRDLNQLAGYNATLKIVIYNEVLCFLFLKN